MVKTVLDTSKKARLLAVAGDETRFKILSFMFRRKKACVSDIAKALGMTIGCISHHLQIMRDNGFFDTKREGNNICYTLVDSSFNKKLKNLITH